ncbi:hypothetical protein FYJ43_07540 [Cutibacterium sp. WCA-380-WT-3A]|uniref:Uncharacterized protein n=1 Tax=Cutibacterium porci TaxID=2605781 RepID=A0A7K0J7F9_9ACTN|nr:hypothetical protein [Cutibacterium porci]MSS45891.1 hypothetical protein [Cutibacterium porci]
MLCVMFFGLSGAALVVLDGGWIGIECSLVLTVGVGFGSVGWAAALCGGVVVAGSAGWSWDCGFVVSGLVW